MNRSFPAISLDRTARGHLSLASYFSGIGSHFFHGFHLVPVVDFKQDQHLFQA
jgi:hypothetical protein